MLQIDNTEEITIVKEDLFRSKSGINQDYDMIRVILDMPIWRYNSLFTFIKNKEEK